MLNKKGQIQNGRRRQPLEVPQPDCVCCIREALEKKGLSADVGTAVLQSWRPGTNKALTTWDGNSGEIGVINGGLISTKRLKKT
ncbi:uncharacterized protein LOC117319285 isoform X2 [Pecten maximus]|uniref:uncharacterized protein LOC117319285 isoform X2 n=1 Tax=Pecten maximus TaxID=6579 RepID=UPI0014587F87|nr:uncharacterized protein LOC117319285 isoform X2 [Pecten maximus]